MGDFIIMIYSGSGYATHNLNNTVHIVNNNNKDVKFFTLHSSGLYFSRFDDTFGLMKSLMVYGSRVVQTPIEEGGDPNIGPNAGPTYFN
jgi:hypothetical protein